MADHVERPAGEDIQQLASDVGTLAPGAGGDMKRVIGLLEQAQRCARPQARRDRGYELYVGKLVARSLQEQHWNPHVEQMHRAFVRRALRRMQREAEKGEASDAGQR